MALARVMTVYPAPVQPRYESTPLMSCCCLSASTRALKLDRSSPQLLNQLQASTCQHPACLALREVQPSTSKLSITVLQVAMRPDVIVISPSAIIDHVATVTESQVIELLDVCQRSEEIETRVQRSALTSELGGSHRVGQHVVSQLLEHLHHFGNGVHSVPAASAVNVARNLARQGLHARLVTACGDDTWGQIFQEELQAVGVNLTYLTSQQGGHTGQSVVLCHSGHRTMRTYLDPSTMLRADQLQPYHFSISSGQPVDGVVSAQQPDDTTKQRGNAMLQQGHIGSCAQSTNSNNERGAALLAPKRAAADCADSTGGRDQPVGSVQAANVSSTAIGCHTNRQHQSQLPALVFISAYAAYSPGLLQRACMLSHQAGLPVVLDLASFEVVSQHKQLLLELLHGQLVHLCICNEDEARALSSSLALASCSQQTDQATDTSLHEALKPLNPHEAAVGTYLAQFCKMVVVTLGRRGCALFGTALQAPSIARPSDPTIRDPLPSGLPTTATAEPEDPVQGNHLANPSALSQDTSSDVSDRQACKETASSSGRQAVTWQLPGGCKMLYVPAVPGIAAVDSTGAGDAFTAALLAGLCKGQPPDVCVAWGCAAGARMVQVLGPDLGPTGW